MDKIFTSSRRVLARDFNQQWLRDRAREMCLETNRKHRKIWEFAAIAQVFRENFANNPQEAIKCLGFGVGLEPLTSWLAAQNAKVLATDKPEMGPWSGQFASCKADLFEKGIVEEEKFRDNVSFLPLDMNDIAENILCGEFDFTWSCGSFEHVGGIDASLDFFCTQMKALKPGGIATHTTEYNFGSDAETINAKDLVLFRQRDLECLDEMLRAQGDRLFPLDLRGGDLPEDVIVDDPPYVNPTHLALRISQIHVSTSIILIAQRGLA